MFLMQKFLASITPIFALQQDQKPSTKRHTKSHTNTDNISNEKDEITRDFIYQQKHLQLFRWNISIQYSHDTIRVFHSETRITLKQLCDLTLLKMLISNVETTLTKQLCHLTLLKMLISDAEKTEKLKMYIKILIYTHILCFSWTLAVHVFLQLFQPAALCLFYLFELEHQIRLKYLTFENLVAS